MLSCLFNSLTYGIINVQKFPSACQAKNIYLSRYRHGPNLFICECFHFCFSPDIWAASFTFRMSMSIRSSFISTTFTICIGIYIFAILHAYGRAHYVSQGKVLVWPSNHLDPTRTVSSCTSFHFLAVILWPSLRHIVSREVWHETGVRRGLGAGIRPVSDQTRYLRQQRLACFLFVLRDPPCLQLHPWLALTRSN